MCKDLAGYHKRSEALPGFDQLETSVQLRWMSGPQGLLNRKDFWSVVAKGAHVHRADVESLGERVVKLTNGDEIETDLLLCCTGWKITLPFMPLEEKKRLGLPHELSEADAENEAHWRDLEMTADAEILGRFPNLAKGPPPIKPLVPRTPYRLHRNMVPLDDSSIVFLGHITSPNAFLVAPVQALWACAYLQEEVKLPHREDMEEAIASWVAWNKRRYPTQGHLGHFMFYEMMGYIDRLLSDLGVSSHKSGSWWTDLTSPNRVETFAGISDEYKSKRVGKAGV